MDMIVTGTRRTASTGQHSYFFTYRVDLPGGQVHEVHGSTAASPALSEIQLQELVLSAWAEEQGVPVADMVITRFLYVSLEPVTVSVVSLSRPAVPPDSQV